ncbi:MAG: hypothetical protein A3H64_03095 [Candidatus Ryanbacteria bacterium RIFCSPLOWO2_02_FULL_45_11c]|uniref:DUF4258 domain-containing protein n=1 Tax=Candidatus Ryanbacteria bacterium RIFCSPLOWO2_02_FULL_45_11c TaxID=1802128 RepID=A0A1G2H1F5_9BACT|nr:MAG: hypothetical protein A3H64_03095 [Candidatus Ryanbacteria bacterium RIFCSPLOWO2_02_FULL_45_11c]
MDIRFTKHADEKFVTLARHGVRISRKKVITTVQDPDLIDHSHTPLFIAQGILDKAHVLRVVYKKEQQIIKIITFYPGRKSQYEKR